jgi:hypothetical protein
MIHSRVIGCLLVRHNPLRVVKSIHYLSTVSTFKMPKVKCSDNVRLRGFFKGLVKNILLLTGKFYSVNYVKWKSRLRNVLQCNNIVILLNKSCVNREFNAESRQRLLFEKSHSTSSILGTAYEFSKVLCKMMVSSDIPLHKVEAASLRKFLEKYTSHPIPTESTLLLTTRIQSTK